MLKFPPLSASAATLCWRYEGKKVVAHEISPERPRKVGALLQRSARASGNPPEQIAASFQRAHAANAALAPEFRNEAENTLKTSYEAPWQSFLQRERNARVTARAKESITRGRPLAISAVTVMELAKG